MPTAVQIYLVNKDSKFSFQKSWSLLSKRCPLWKIRNTPPHSSQSTIVKTPSTQEIAPDPGFLKLVNFLRKICSAYYARGQGVPCNLQWREDKPFQFGQGEPTVTFKIMDMVHRFRDMTTDKHPLRYICNLAKPLLFGQTKMDRSHIVCPAEVAF